RVAGIARDVQAMLGFFVGTICGAMFGYAARAYLSVRRRRAARLERIAGGTDSRFVPPYHHARDSIDQQASAGRLQSAASDSQPFDLRARTDLRRGV